MKSIVVLAVFVATCASACYAATVIPTRDVVDVDVDVGLDAATMTPTRRLPQDMIKTLPSLDAKIASYDLLNNPAALVNKNTLAMDNNIFAANNKKVFTQNDRLVFRQRAPHTIEAPLLKAKVEREEAVQVRDDNVPIIMADRDQNVRAASKHTLHAVSTPTRDAAVMSRAAGVMVDADDGDQVMSATRIQDLIDALSAYYMGMQKKTDNVQALVQDPVEEHVHTYEQDYEDAIQADLQDGVMLGAGTRDILRQPSGIVNRNMVIADTQATMSRSQMTPRSDTVVDMTDDAKLSDVIVSGSSVMLRGVADAKTRMMMKPKAVQVTVAEGPDPLKQLQEQYVLNIIAQRIGEESEE